MKKEMSRPNTGSVTVPAPAGSNGTRLIHSSSGRPVRCQRAADRQGDEHRDDRDHYATDRRGVGQLVGRHVDRPSGPIAGPPTERLPCPPGPLLGFEDRLVQSVEPAAHRTTGTCTFGGRREAAGEPEIAKQDDERENEAGDEQPNLGAQPGPEHRVVSNAGVPDRVRPQLETDGDHDDDEEHDDHRDGHADLAAEAEPGAVVGPTD